MQVLKLVEGIQRKGCDSMIENVDQNTAPENTIELRQGNRDLRIFAKATLPQKVLSLINQKDFNSKLSWIAKTLGASLDETQDAIDLLEGLGLVKFKNGTLTSEDTPVWIYDRLGKVSKEDIVNNHRIISHQLLNDVDPHNRFFVQYGFNATDEETLAEFNEKIKEAIMWFKTASGKSKKTIVAGYTMTGANIMKEGDKL